MTQGSKRPADLPDFLSNLGKTVQDSINSALEGRGNVLMVRVNDDTLRAIDALVEARLFRTRSEASAFLILEGVRGRRDIYDRINDTVSQIANLRDELRRSVMESDSAEASAPADGPDEGNRERPTI